MKKFLSILLSVVIMASVCAVSVVPAMAQTVGSQQTTTKKTTISVEVNGSSTTDVTYKKDSNDPSVITFTYKGDGELTGWDFGGLTEGIDYEIVSQNGNKITIKLLTNVNVVANAKVKGASTKPNKGDNGNTSPNTGATIAGVAVAGAGVAMLAALKKKND